MTVDVTENYFVYKVQVKVDLTFLLFPLRRIVLLTRRMIPVMLEKKSYKINIIIALGKEIELRSGNNHGKVSSNKLYSNPITCFYASHTYVSRLLFAIIRFFALNSHIPYSTSIYCLAISLSYFNAVSNFRPFGEPCNIQLECPQGKTNSQFYSL